jgi:hypothetical protein
VEAQKIFDNKQLANGNWQLASLAPRSFSMRYDPLPTGQQKRENKAEIEPD